MAVRRRNRPTHRSHHHSSSSSSSSSSAHHGSSSIFKTLTSHPWLNRWFKKGKKKDHSHRPPNALQHKHQHHDDDDDEVADSQVKSQQLWHQSVNSFKTIISARICSAIWSHIADCDETFNYWEPAHYLIYGSGFQTWEYSPTYAIRSYAFIYLYTIPAFICNLFFSSSSSSSSPSSSGHLQQQQQQQLNKSLIFVMSRIFLALICTLCEVYFLRGIYHRFGSFVSKITLAILVFSIGMTIASVSFLPSTFSMYCILIMTAAWLMDHHITCILANVINVMLGWPFAALAAAPIVMHVAVQHRNQWQHLLKWSLICIIIVAVPVIAIDSYMYGKLVIAPLNIVLYNVMSSKGPELYGSEEWYFYLFNLFLNFNLIFVAAITAIPVFAISKLCTKNVPVSSYHFTLVSSLLLWALVFGTQAHKEERFMFPIYPLICLTAGLAIEVTIEMASNISPKLSSFCLNISLAMLMLSAGISISRGVALYRGFSAPIDVYRHLHQINDRMVHVMNYDFGPDVNVCVGKEWHRFPSSFFLPDNKWKLRFLKSQFSGQLPKPFAESWNNGTTMIPSDMNDENREEFSRYFDISKCHFLIDSDYDNYSGHDYPYSRSGKDFEIITSEPFLDTRTTESLYRSFYVPILSEKRWKMIGYNLLKNLNTTNDFPIKL